MVISAIMAGCSLRVVNRMTRRFYLWSLAIFFAVCCGSRVLADVKKRWRLDFEAGEPRPFTYADQANDRTNLIYFPFKVTNKTDQECPLYIDVVLRTDRGRFYRPRPMPGAEEQIICQLQKLGGYSVQEKKERIQELKTAGRFLSLYELAIRNTIKPGETIEVLALFPRVAYNFEKIHFYVSGLVDVVKFNYEAARAVLRGEQTGQSAYDFENHVLMLTYRTPATSESYVQFNPLDFVERKWVIMNFGPIADKATVKRLIDCLGETALDIKVNIKEEEKNLGEIVKGTVCGLLNKLIGTDFGFDPTKSAEENEMAVKDAKEWWAMNNKKLVFDEKKNIFYIPEN